MLKLILFYITLVSFGPICWAAKSNSHLYINSDDLVINKQNKVALFDGNVFICFDDMSLIAKHAEFRFRDIDIKHMESIYFSDGIKLLKSDGTVVVASKAFYNSDKYELLLEDDVIISKDDYIVRANEVTYYGEIKLLKLTGE